MQKITISEKLENGRLDKFLQKHLPNAGLSFLYKMLRKKNITLNGKKATGKEILKSGDEIEMFFSEETYQAFHTGKGIALKDYEKAYHSIGDLQVLYEDSDILLLNKPVGVLSQKASQNDISANEWLIGYLLKKGEIDASSLQESKPSVCNRLDRNTAGILLCGKTIAGCRALSEAVKNRDIEKYYLCVVKGTGIQEGIMKASLKKDNTNNKVKISNEESGEQTIQTGIQVLASNNSLSLLKIQLFTGKTHQIRAHLSSIQHPIIGDYKYGNVSFNDKMKQAYGLESQFLCACEVVFPRECTSILELQGKTIRCPLPSLFQDILIKENLLTWQHGTPEDFVDQR